MSPPAFARLHHALGPRARRLSALALLVGLGHAWLADGWLRGGAAPAVAPALASAAGARAPVLLTPLRVGAAAQAVGLGVPLPIETTERHAPTAPKLAALPRPAAKLPRPASAEAAAASAPGALASPGQPALPMPSLAELEPALPVLPTPADAQDTAQAPPVYATQVPAPARLRFVAKVNGQTGSGVLDWQHDGQRYRATLRVLGPQRPLIEQESTGAFDAHGLAPERFVDRRRGRLVGAAHFRRDSARISFSGPQTDYPAWPGAQDRLAWLPQLVAVAAAAANAAANAAASAQADSASAAPTEISLFVADARGLARLWVFQAMGEDAVVTDGGSVPALRWLRAPQRSDELRVEVWLDPARGHWPVRLVQTAPFSGAVVDLVRSEAPP